MSSKKKISYIHGKLLTASNGFLCTLYSAALGRIAGVSVINSVHLINNISGGSGESLYLLPLEMCIAGISSFYAASFLKNAFYEFACRRALKSKLKSINPEDNPLQFIDEIEITDTKGLEALLERTWENESLEWGTVLKTEEHKNKAYTTEIKNPFSKETDRFFKYRKRTSLGLNFKTIVDNGYNGIHHFHPRLLRSDINAIDYSVNYIDRNRPEEWVNMLSFNLKNEPEIIGYNLRSIFIPAEKTKRKLIRAEHKDILNYLSK